jgi:hypothetical protein
VPVARPVPPVRRLGPRITPEIKQAARNMQVAMLQLPGTPDFRRAASHALHAKCVPLAFRQRQYRRFRSQFVEHFARLLSNGAPADALMPGLTQLVTALGIAPFEADYIRQEAEAHVIRPEPSLPDFRQQLQEAHAEYRSRVRTLESVTELDQETREQLLEQEQLRFQERLRTLAGMERNDA